MTLRRCFGRAGTGLAVAAAIGLCWVAWQQLDTRHCAPTTETPGSAAKLRVATGLQPAPRLPAVVAPKPPSRMIVVARGTEDTSWLDTYFNDVPHTVMQQTELYMATNANRANLGCATSRRHSLARRTTCRRHGASRASRPAHNAAMLTPLLFPAGRRPPRICCTSCGCECSSGPGGIAPPAPPALPPAALPLSSRHDCLAP